MEGSNKKQVVKQELEEKDLEQAPGAGENDCTLYHPGCKKYILEK